MKILSMAMYQNNGYQCNQSAMTKKLASAMKKISLLSIMQYQSMSFISRRQCGEMQQYLA